MKHKFLLLTLSVLVLSACGNNDTDPSKQNSYKVDFSTYDLGQAGLIQSSDPTFISKIISFINEDNYIVTSIECTKENRVKLEKDIFPEGYGSVQALILGSQNGDGNISFTFSRTLKSVKLKAQQYYSITPGHKTDTHVYPYYDSQLWDEEKSESIPRPATFTINQEVWTNLEIITYTYDDDGYAIANIPTICERTFTINSKVLSLTALESQRVRVYEMLLEFEAE